ncbi:MAG TPA: gamma-glutamylcyclotransferase, partial [Pseudomonadales bacterium]|nr:gamma-glutamylcyclotransferase [Pseudomonadales bacterium]
MIIAVNGTLMQDQPTNHLLVKAGAQFVRAARTAPIYRLWNVGDKHPGMLRDEQGGAPISLELWEIRPE